MKLFSLMNYVIQNFYKPNVKFSPSLKYRLFFNTLNFFKIYTFYRLFEFTNKINFNLYYFYSQFNAFKKLYYWDSLLDFYDIFELPLLPHWTNKFQKRLRLHALQNFNLLFTPASVYKMKYKPHIQLLYSQYFFTEFYVFVALHEKIYKQIFFLSFLFNLHLWPIVSEFFNFECVYFLVHSEFKFLYFLNKKSFKIQRF